MILPEYDRLDAIALADLVARGEVAPAELLQAAIARVEARNPALNAVIERFDDEARRVAAGPLPSGPFRGVPFLLKDLRARYAGQPLTDSSSALVGFVPDHDSEVVRRFQAAGLVIFGRTNTSELGIMPVTEPRLRGPCKNPWDLSRTPGGSSGGSAAAVAARMVPMAHGSDGGGSIRIPASACGLFGLKPTRGRVSAAPDAGEIWSGLSQDHVLTRSVRDSAAVLDILAGNVEGDPYRAPPVARPFREEAGTPPRRLRIAFSAESLLGRTTHPDCRAALEVAVRLVADLGHEVVEARPELSREELARAFLLLLAASVRAHIEAACRAMGRGPSPELFEPETWALGLAGLLTPASELVRAREAAYAAGRSLARFHERHDVFVTPTVAHPPVEVGHFELKPVERLGVAALRAFPTRRFADRLVEVIARNVLETVPNTPLFNLTGQPAMSVPLHWTDAGLPIGTQFAARFGDEATLFRLAAQMEEARPWAGRMPPEA